MCEKYKISNLAKWKASSFYREKLISFINNMLFLLYLKIFNKRTFTLISISINFSPAYLSIFNNA